MSLRQDAYARALISLHVGSLPEPLVCRREQYEEIDATITEFLESNSGGCIYISGVPGTGKTATVQTLVRNRQNLHRSTDGLRYLEINGLRITDPSSAYVLLWEALSGSGSLSIDTNSKRPSSRAALEHLTRYFNNQNRQDKAPLIVLMDELDQLMTRQQDVLYNFFDWPSFPNSRLVVIAISNTHDLPERLMSSRVRSRLGMTRITFAPYKHESLQEIVRDRLRIARAVDTIAGDAIKLAALRVSNISGDARRMLDICRRGVEVAIIADTARVTTAQINNVITIMQQTPTAKYLKNCSLHERIMLASLYSCTRRSGLIAVSWKEVRQYHLLCAEQLGQVNGLNHMPTTSQLRLVLSSLCASHAVIFEGGSWAERQPEEQRRVVLNLESTELQNVLLQIGGETWRQILAM